MPRARNPRRQALEQLREMAGWIKTMVKVWDQSMTTFEVQYENGKPTNHWTRPLRPEEMRENDVEHWKQLDRYMVGITVRATELSEFARERIAELKAKETAGVR